MAEKERGDSHAMTCDEIEEMYCELCKMKGRFRTAESFCVDCVQYFCSSCTKSHSYFLPTHIQKDKSNMPQDVCLKPCPTHSAEIIKFYCSACDQFFCSICNKNDHSQCNTVSHLPILVQVLDLTKTFNEVNTTLENTMEAIEKRESKVIEKSKLAYEYAENANSALQLKKTLVLQWLDRNVGSIEHDIEAIQSYDGKTIKAECSALSSIKDQTNTLKTRLNNKSLWAKKCELFMTLKETENQQKQIEKSLGPVEEHVVTFYEFESSDDCEKLLEDKFLGKIERKARYKDAKIEITTKNITHESSVINITIESTEIGCAADVTPIEEETSFTTKASKAIEDANVEKPTNIETPKSIVAEYLQRPLIQGEIWYVVDSNWFKQWKRYVGYDPWDTYHVEKSAYPGSIDNTPILQQGSAKLKENLIEDLDYIVVPENCWNRLLSWYWIAGEKGSLPRKVILEGVYEKSLKVEVYPWMLKLSEHSNPDKQLSQLFSRSDSIGYLEKVMRDMFGISAERQVRLWNRYMTNMFELKEKEKTLQEAGLYQGLLIVIEQQNTDGTWPRAQSFKNNKQTLL